jgi:hypothetical protein
MDRLQKVMEALLNVNSPDRATPIATRTIPPIQTPNNTTTNSRYQEAPEDPRPEEQYIPPTAASFQPQRRSTPPVAVKAISYQTPELKQSPLTTQPTYRAITAVKTTKQGMKYISPAETTTTSNTIENKNKQVQERASTQSKGSTVGTHKSGKTRSIGGVIKLWTNPNQPKEPDPIFDEWKIVEKRGKRNAETSHLGEPKCSDKREKPTKMK